MADRRCGAGRRDRKAAKTSGVQQARQGKAASAQRSADGAGAKTAGGSTAHVRLGPPPAARAGRTRKREVGDGAAPGEAQHLSVVRPRSRLGSVKHANLWLGWGEVG